MQVYFDMNYTNRTDFLDEHKRVLESRLHSVTREITDSRARTREDLECKSLSVNVVFEYLIAILEEFCIKLCEALWLFYVVP